MSDPPPPPPPPPLTLHRTVSAGGIPVFRGGDIIVKHRPDLNFDGLRPAPDRVWFGNMTFEVAREEWTVDKFLNFGAEGQTYLVTRTQTGEKFAAKFCTKEDSMEVNIVQELPRQLVTHENFIKYELIVLNVHEIFAPAHHIIFMEHIPNGELFDVLASQEPSVAGKPLAEGTSRRILRDVISGMAECYRFGVTHRDLKPENLLINEHGRIVIIDMGHAKRVAASGAPSPLALSRTTTQPRPIPMERQPSMLLSCLGAGHMTVSGLMCGAWESLHSTCTVSSQHLMLVEVWLIGKMSVDPTMICSGGRSSPPATILSFRRN